MACVSNQPIRAVGANRTPYVPASVSFLPLDMPAPLRLTSGARLWLSFRFDVTTRVSPDENGVQAMPVSYGFRLSDRSDDELMAFHWHPVGLSPVVLPHLHLSSRLPELAVDGGRANLALAALHIPTGHVALSDIVRFLIAEVGVEPRRSDWMDVLAGIGV